jgi:hypothetical protein
MCKKDPTNYLPFGNQILILAHPSAMFLLDTVKSV